MHSKIARIFIAIFTVIAPATAYSTSVDWVQVAANLPTHTKVFLGVAAALTIFFGHIKFDRFAVAHGPEILTTWGIFGCFYGVSVGLFDFNTKDIGASVPMLLEGLRTAFWVSLAGVAGALYLKLRHRISRVPIPQSDSAPKAANLDDLVAVALQVQKGVIGSDEGTLLGQLKLMRQDQRDGLRSLTESFNSFAEKMADNNSKALIEALKEVIRDFNAKINEQFGDNFKQLNAAVEKLVVWQHQYKVELEAVKDAQQKSAEDMRVASAAFSTLVNHAEEYTRTAQNLDTLLKAVAVELSRGLEIERSLHAALSDMQKVAPTFAEKASLMLDDVKKGTEAIRGEFEAIAKSTTASLQTTQSEMRRLLAESMSETHKQMSTHLRALSEETKDQVIALDKALDKELNRALETLGQQLTALSRKFVEDYGPLTERLRQIVAISRGV